MPRQKTAPGEKAKAARAAVKRHPRLDRDAFAAFVASVREVVAEHGNSIAACDWSLEVSGAAGERVVSLWIAEPGRRVRLQRERPRRRKRRKSKAKA